MHWNEEPSFLQHESENLASPLPSFSITGQDGRTRRGLNRPTPLVSRLPILLASSSTHHSHSGLEIAVKFQHGPQVSYHVSWFISEYQNAKRQPATRVSLFPFLFNAYTNNLFYSAIYGLLAMSILSPIHSSTRSLRKTPSLSVVTDPVMPSSPWMTETHSPGGRMVCV